VFLSQSPEIVAAVLANPGSGAAQVLAQSPNYGDDIEAALLAAGLVAGTPEYEAEQQLAAQANIRSIPMLMAFREGVLVFSQAGALPGHVLEDLITQIKGLDMAEVHRQVAEETGTG
jgi:hypothetical protein